MITKAQRKQLFSLHATQLRTFRSKAASLQKELGEIPEAEQFLATINRLSELVSQRAAAAEGLFAGAANVAGEGNRTPAFLQANTGPHVYNYLTADRLMAEQIGQMDEFQKGIACAADMRKAAQGRQDLSADQWKQIHLTGWRLLTMQHQSRSLQRMAEAISATQTSILRSFGLQFWAGRGRIVRWEGQE